MASLTLERLLFDPSDSTGPIVGSYLLGTGGEVLDSTSGALNVNIENASVVVSATDLDIRDLVYTADSVTAHQGGTWSNKITDGTDELAINNDGSLNATVSATDLDIRDLVYTSDSVTAHQGGTWSVTTDITPNIVPLSSAVSVTDTEVALPTTPLAGRTHLMIQNLGADPVYIGKTGVTTSTGIKVEKGATFTSRAGASALYFGIAPAGKTVAVRLLES